MMKKSILIALTLLAIGSLAQANQTCEVVDQSGSLDSWYCRYSDFKIRCYADVKYTDGSTDTIWDGTDSDGSVADTGTCYQSYMDCWSSGQGRVNPSCEW